jgi:ketosteroid isomerase-like protein
MKAEADAARPLIGAQLAQYSRGAAAGNADTMLAMYAPDAVVMPPNQKVTTMDSLRARLARIGPFQVSFATRALTVNGPVAIERGVFSAVLSPPGAALAVVRDGKYLAHWQRINNEWLMVEHIWNDDYQPIALP